MQLIAISLSSQSALALNCPVADGGRVEKQKSVGIYTINRLDVSDTYLTL
jgi:hypothetical protein